MAGKKIERINLPVELQEAAAERKLLPMIGSGFSKNINAKFPDWKEAINDAAKGLGYSSGIIHMYGDFYQIAEYLFLEKKSDEFVNSLVKLFEDYDANDVSKSKPHLLLPYLDVSTIVTTNWDSWIEKSFDREKIAYSKISSNDDLYSPKYRDGFDDDRSKCLYPSNKVKKYRDQNNSTQIIKFHGDFTSRGSIVFKESDFFKRLDFEDPIDVRLRSELFGKSVVFIGYSFNDINLRYMWHKLLKKTHDIDGRLKSYFITFQRNPIMRKIFETWGIETVELDINNRTKALELFLEQLINSQ